MKKILLLLLAGVLCMSCQREIYEIYGSLSGVVVDADGSAPLRGVKITITPGGTSQVTAEDGTFSFEELIPQEYTVNFTKEGYHSATQKVSVKAGASAGVQVALKDIKPVLSVGPTKLDFGYDSSTLPFDITNTGKGELIWLLREDIPWLSCSIDKDTTTDKVSSVIASVSRQDLSPGSYSGSIVISSNGGSQTISVAMTVRTMGLSVTPQELDFGTLTNTIQLEIKNETGSTIKYTVQSSNEWLLTNKETGTISDIDYLSVIVRREGLSEGDYNGTLLLSTSGSELAVPVKMAVATNERPVVSLESVEAVTYNSALLHGLIVSPGSANITRYGVCYSETPNPTIDDNSTNLGDNSSPCSFESRITNLNANTAYYVRAYAVNSVGLAYSEKELSFTTAELPTIPTVTTGDITEISSRSAVLPGCIVSLGNVTALSDYGHVWAKIAEPTLQNGAFTSLGERTEVGDYTSSVENLEPYTEYYVRAYAKNEKGTAYGEVKTFKTTQTDVILSTAEVTEIIHNAATCGGTVQTTGGYTIAERGVCWSTSAHPTVANSTAVASGEKFTCRMTGLSTLTSYYVRAYVKTDENTVFYGDEKKFATTKEVSAPKLTNVSVSNITTTAAAVSSTVSFDGNSSITSCGFVYAQSPDPTTQSGTILTCSPSSASLGRSITGLMPGTTYYVRAYAQNAVDITYTPSREFTTLAITLPQLSPVSVTNIGRTTAQVSAFVVSDGNATVTECGFCWSENPYPTISDHQIACTTSGSFNTKLTGLPLTTTVYVRAYASNSMGIAYSDELTFMTADVDLDIWEGGIATRFGGGMGTASNPIIINAADQLALLAQNVNNGQSYGGVYFLLDLNINLDNKDWASINGFAGFFDGNNKTISGLTSSLFGQNSGTIRGITVEGNISTCAGICTQNRGTVENCTNKATINTYVDNVGGIVGTNNGTIQNCVNNGSISGKDNIGGIVGNTFSEVLCCYNYGSIIGHSYVGGIMGCVKLISDQYTDKMISYYNLCNTGTISGNGAGGICGYTAVEITKNIYLFETYNYSINYNNCINTGFVQGTQCGGIVGLVTACSAYYHSQGNGSHYVYANCGFYNVVNISDNSCTGEWSTASLGSTYGYGCFFDVSKTYWLNDIVNNIGEEKAISVISGTSASSSNNSDNWFTRDGAGCYKKGTNEDIVTLLNNWINTQSDGITYKRWKYTTKDGYACLVFDE